MREDPVISGGVLKVVLVVLIAGALGAGGFALAGGDIDLPVDLPDLETTAGPVTELSDTNLQDTTIGHEPEPEATDPFTSAGFGEALAKVKDAAGPDQKLTRLFINEVQTQMIIQQGDGIEAYSVRADTGELVREEATITISGDAKIEDFAFSLDAIDAGAVDRMLADARGLSGAEDFEPTVLSLERGIPFGRRALEWTINARGDGRNLLYRADADGKNVRNEGGKGTAIPPAAIEAEKLTECIEAAGENPEEIFACLDQFQ